MKTHSAAGCAGTVSWNVTGTGASISSNGVLTTGPASCGAINIVANCSDGTSATKWVRISDGGHWAIVESCGSCAYSCCSYVYEGKYRYQICWSGNCCGGPLTCDNKFGDCQTCAQSPASECNATAPSRQKPDGTICGCSSGNVCAWCCIPNWRKSEWQCPAVCTDGQTKPCPYTGPAGTENIGECKAGVQTCVNGQWGACEGEVLPTPEICGNNIDENCDGNVDEGCEKILKYISGNGQEDYICKTLKNPFVVSISGATQGSAGVNWQVTEAPSGSNASIVGETTTFTDSEIISSAYLKLGSLPGSYTTEARCSECTSGSPQRFSADAICPDVPKYYQDDYKEPYDNICAVGINPKTKKKYGVKKCAKDAQGNVLPTEIRHTIAGKGCALTSIAMVMGLYGISSQPNALDNTMNEPKINGYDNKGRVKWSAINTITEQQLQYQSSSAHVGDIEEGDAVQKSLMNKYLEKCMPVIVQVVNPRSGNGHWIVVTGKVGNDYTVNDPDSGNKGLKWLSKYGDIYNIRIYKNQRGGCQ